MTFDIETVDKQGVSDLLGDTVYISWCVNGLEDGYPSDDLTGWFLRDVFTEERNGYIIYAHNGLGFDFKRLNWSHLAELGYTAEFLVGKNSSLKAATVTKDDCTWFLRDSLLLLPMSLAKAAKTFAPNELKITREKGFDEQPFNPHDPTDQAYANQDPRALWWVIFHADRLLKQTFDVSIHDAFTAPGIAYRSFRQSFDSRDEAGKYDGEEFPGVSYLSAFASRESYHGGQTIAFNTELHVDEVSIDCNSMYGHVMVEYPLPTGKSEHRIGLDPSSDPERTLCLAVVHIPENVFPHLKSKGRNRKIGNYVGVVSGWYWLFELEYQKKLGATYEVVESFMWNETTEVVSEFVGKCKRLRMTDYHGGKGDIAKLIQNSLYGKFAQTTAEMGVVLSATKPENAVSFYDPATGEEIEYLWYIPVEKSFRADMVHWASFITAHARLELSKAIELVGFNHIDYCDTDSLFFERKYLDRVESILGEQYGQFKIEKNMQEFQAFAPKAYKYTENNKRAMKNKGIPSRDAMKQDGYNKLGNENEDIHFISSNSMINMLKRNLPYGRKAHRKLATPKSTTNGTLEGGIWVPSTTDPRPLTELRNDQPTSLYMQKVYDRLVAKMQKLGGDQFERCFRT